MDVFLLQIVLMNSNIRHYLYDHFLELGMSEPMARYLNVVGLLLAMIVLVDILDLVLWKVIRIISARLARYTKTKFDDIVIANRLPFYLAHIFPLVLILELLPEVFVDFPYWENVAMKTAYILAVVLGITIFRSLLNSIKDYLKTLDHFKDKPIDSYIQVVMIFAWLSGTLTILAIMTDIPIWTFFTTLGAASAIIILVFKDTILGFVASIQVAINDMVRIGDWISFEKYGADGSVIGITLATVKVQNWDKTITTIPTYALISDSFKNWRGMTESGGRRIKRALIIKQEKVRFLTDEDVEKLKKIHLIENYLNTISKKINDYNQGNNIDKSLPLNGRNLTNLGVFRKYVQTYLEKHSALNQNMTLMTRQLAPTSQGIPIEIYTFSADIRWQNYEYIMADIFDHLISAVPYFDLEIFELPSSYVPGSIPQVSDSGLKA